jgi:hypothetical protein
MMRFIIGQWPLNTDAGSRRRITVPRSCTIPARNASFASDGTPPVNITAFVRPSRRVVEPHSPGLYRA